MSHTDRNNKLGLGDKLGKVVAPVIFGVFNMILAFFVSWSLYPYGMLADSLLHSSLIQVLFLSLSFFARKWGDGPWILFYLSMALCLLVVYVSRKDDQKFERSVIERMAKSFHSSTLGLGHSVSGEVDSSPESTVRYMRWQVMKRKNRGAQDASGRPLRNQTSALTSNTAFSSHLSNTIDEEVEIDFDLERDNAAKKVQHAFRKHQSEKLQQDTTEDSHIDRDSFLSSLLFKSNAQVS